MSVRLQSILCRFAKDHRAVTALEYGMIAALIAATIVFSVTYLGNSVSNTFSFLGSTINTNSNGGGGGTKTSVMS